MNKNPEKLYTLEFKESSANLAMDSEQSMAQTARDLGINENTLYGWVRKYRPESVCGSTTKPNATATVYEELKRLQKENARLKQEREILKKRRRTSRTT